MKRTLVLALLFSGCATSGHLELPDIKEITRDDAKAAFTIAADNGDVAGMACVAAIQDELLEREKPRPQVKGALSAYMLTRAAVHRETGGYGGKVHIACAPLVVDAARTLGRLGITAAGGPGGWVKTGAGFLRGLDQVR